ncbi:hypothetical protein KC19_7G153400 [Ceratodon purpureus]|uniref:Uncharacterized protein n=1 Tax=Ceratodon purpureus TaxID=3225 RepID=A0A8T0HBG9_CERPU|nr:hypothetical protein KC19_7G153400 [Ceratodon purpureus]
MHAVWIANLRLQCGAVVPLLTPTTTGDSLVVS